MSLLETWIKTPAARALGWTVFHSLWQGAIIALALAAGLSALRSSRARYAAACVAMLGMLAGFGLTFARQMSQGRATVLLEGAATANRQGIPADTNGMVEPWSMAESPAQRLAADVLPWLAPFWMAGVLLFHLRSLTGWLATRHLCRTGVCCAPDLWQDRLNRLGARLRLSQGVTLLESCLAEVPIVIGHVRPVILVPVDLFAGLPAGQIETILLHELAHIRRYDYLVNLLQTYAENLLFYHPAVWWISRVVRNEREHCCDDLVVATSGDAHEYALALAALEQNRSFIREPALAASGGSLVKRIRRLLGQPEGPRPAWSPALSAAIVTVTVVFALRAWQSKPSDTLPPPPAPASPAAKAEVKLLAQAQQAPPAARGQEAETHKLNDDLALPARYRQWLEMEVTYIITDQERAVFRSLRTDEERDQFIEQFWLRRDPTPATVENEYKEEHYRRISYSSERFRAANIPGWKTDRGRTYILYGSPDEIESHPSGGPTTYPFEQWLYRHLDGGGDNVVIEFVNRAGAGEFRRASSPLEKYTLTANPEAAPDVRVGRSGVIVEAPNGTALISIPLRSYGDRVNVFGRIMDNHGRVVNFFDDNVRLSRSPAHEGVVVSLYNKSLALPAGSYRLTVVVKDLTTGVSTDEDMSFDVH